MRGLPSTLALLVVLVGLGAYIYFVERHRPPSSETPPNEQVFDLQADAIVGLAVALDDGTRTELEKVDDSWRIVSPLDTQADETSVSSLITSVASLEVQRVVDEAPADLAPFGLVAPAVELGITAGEDETERRLLIGDETPTGADRYAKLTDSDRVFLISSFLESTFRKTTFDLRDKSILDFARDDVDAITITRSSEAIRLNKDGTDWSMVEPWGVRADFSTTEGLLGRLGSGRMQAIEVEETEDLEPFGLTEPVVTVAIGAGSATATLLVGGTSPDGTRFARDASRPMVFTIETSLAEELERDASEYRRKDLFEFRPFNATRLEVERPDGRVVFEKTTVVADDESEGTDAEVWARVEPTDAEVERVEMDDLLGQLSRLRAESFVASRADAGLGDDAAVATFRVQYEVDDQTETETVTVWQTTDTTYAVNGDEPGAAEISTSSFDDALAAIDALGTSDSDEPA